MTKRAFISCVLVMTAALSVAGRAVAHAQMVGEPEVTPRVIEADVETLVTVKSRIADPNLIRDSVLLQRVDADGHVVQILGSMTADAGSDLFTLQVPLTLSLGTSALLRVSAGFLGHLLRTTCGDIEVTAVSHFVSDFTPQGIKAYLMNNPEVRSAATFLERLRAEEFKQYWIMMTASDSSQSGTATHPRLIIPNKESDAVFGVQSGSDVLEYIQFDSVKKRFRFHSIDTQAGTVTKDNPGCTSCHSGPRPGESWPYPRPNWDAYDSWGGALPYNRDRIYKDSEEETAVKRLLKDLRTDPIVGQLDLPDGITRACNGDVTITFDSNDNGNGTVDVFYKEDDRGNVTYPGAVPDVTGDVVVGQGGEYLVLHHPLAPDRDEGRGVRLFDQFTEFNAMRIAQEIIDKPRDMAGVDFVTRVDIRPVTLAIAKGCVDGTNLGDFAPKEALQAFETYHGMNFAELKDDTLKQQQLLPKLKADQESGNLGGADGLIAADGGSPNPTTITKDVFRRSPQGRYTQDQITPHMIDREIYGDNTEKIALFRYFLEPSQEPVNKWTMSLSGTLLEHSTTYTFGDVFPKYLARLQQVLGEEQISDHFGSDPDLGGNKSCEQLKHDSYDWYEQAITNNPDYFKRSRGSLQPN